MKKVLIYCLTFIFILTLASCAIKTDSFSWAEDESYYAGIDDAGLKRDGFVNITETSVNNAADALRLAQNEHKLLSEESYSVFYDVNAHMWKVSFYPKDNNVLGGCIDVYLNDKGITQLIAAGE